MGRRGPQAGSSKRGSPTGIRFDPELKTRLETAKKASGRSFSEEVSARLQASFGSIQFNDHLTHGLAILIADALDTIDAHEGHPWYETRRCWIFAKQAIMELLSYFEPRDEESKVPDDHPLLLPMRAQGLSDEAIAQMKEQLNTSDLGRMAGRLAMVRCEAVAEHPGNQFAERFGSIAVIVKQRIEAAGNADALQDLKQKGLALLFQGETRRIDAKLPADAHLRPVPITTKSDRTVKGDKQ